MTSHESERCLAKARGRNCSGLSVGEDGVVVLNCWFVALQMGRKVANCEMSKGHKPKHKSMVNISPECSAELKNELCCKVLN